MDVTMQDRDVEGCGRAWDLTPYGPDVRSWRDRVAAVVADLGADAGAVGLVRLGVSELLSNVVKHVPDRRCRLLIQAGGGLVRVSVFDWGRGVPAVGVPDGDAESGRGLCLLRALVDDWGWTSAFVDGQLGKWVWFSVASGAQGREGER